MKVDMKPPENNLISSSESSLSLPMDIIDIIARILATRNHRGTLASLVLASQETYTVTIPVLYCKSMFLTQDAIRSLVNLDIAARVSGHYDRTARLDRLFLSATYLQLDLSPSESLIELLKEWLDGASRLTLFPNVTKLTLKRYRFAHDGRMFPLELCAPQNLCVLYNEGCIEPRTTGHTESFAEICFHAYTLEDPYPDWMPSARVVKLYKPFLNLVDSDFRVSENLANQLRYTFWNARAPRAAGVVFKLNLGEPCLSARGEWEKLIGDARWVKQWGAAGPPDVHFMSGHNKEPCITCADHFHPTILSFGELFMAMRRKSASSVLL